MRVIYADPGLRDNLGRHANVCRAITTEFRQRGFAVSIFAHRAITEALRDEFDATPLFRAYTYWQTDGEPIAGALTMFDASAQATAEDLACLASIAADDIVYLNSAQPAQLMALILWMRGLDASRRPHIVLEFGTDPGIDVQLVDGQPKLMLRDYRQDPRAMFYRFAANKLPDDLLPRFHMVTFDSNASTLYRSMLAKPVSMLPPPQSAPIPVRSRADRRPVTVSVLGHQRPDKGYRLMPEIARLLLAYEGDIRLLIHNGAPDDMVRTQQELRAHAAVEQRITLNEETADPTLWADLLSASDLILCPYEPARFLACYSAVVAEAVASGIPVVVPGETALSRLLSEFGDPGVSFVHYAPGSIVDATRAALADFDALAARAVAASAQWQATMGVTPMVSGLLALCGRG